MAESDAIARSRRPVTRTTIADDLRALGVQRGDVLVVHASLSALGWVNGGGQAVVEALLDVIGPEGTLTMPAHSGALSDPARWANPPVPAAWWEEIRATMPAFDPALTPLREMGEVAETLHRAPGARRSTHPQVSHLALGPHAAFVTEGHSLEDGLGDASPLGRLYDLDASVLLLGVPHANNTSLHLAEFRADWPGKRRVTSGGPVLVDGERRWVTYDEVESDTSDFDEIGAAFATTGGQRAGTVGHGTALLARQRDLVDFAVAWMRANRGRGG